jgi:hypothetical protein
MPKYNYTITLCQKGQPTMYKLSTKNHIDNGGKIDYNASRDNEERKAQWPSYILSTEPWDPPKQPMR